MQTGSDLSVVATLIGEPARAAILTALLGGQSLPAGDLAYHAYITPQTASTHLAKLVAGGLLEVRKVGRHRYYRLKSAEVAYALETLISISSPIRVRSQRLSPEYKALGFARTCYDHLAGKMGVAVTRALVEQGLIVPDEQSYHLTPAGSAWLAEHGIDEQSLHKGRRMFARTCLDWSERQDHLAGALGAALTGWFLENGWVKRLPETRALLLTETGRRGLQQTFGVKLED